MSKLLIGMRVLNVIEANNIDMATLRYMIERAAIVKHPFGNRRFVDWVFDIRGGVCHAMCRFDVLEVGKTGSQHFVYEDHVTCNGAGCAECGWSGQVKRGL